MIFTSYRIRNHTGKLEAVIAEVLGISRRKARKIIDEGLVCVNGIKILKRQFLLKRSSIVEFSISDFLFSMPEIEVIYEDDFILVVNKPPFLNSNLDFPDVESVLKRSFKNIRVIHRLDRQTTGVLMFAKSDDIFDKMVELFRNKEIHKKYRAVVAGILKKEKKVSFSLDGKEAVTYVKPVKYFEKATEALISIETGRKHQIRRHLAFLNHPVVGEFRYFRGSFPFLLRFAPRIMLHAEEVVFKSPFTGKIVKITAPVFDDFSAFINVVERGRKSLPLKEYA